MLQHENLWACIKCKTGGLDEEELQEYEVERDGKIVRCWIPSESGQKFTVHMGHQGTNIGLQWALFVDGIEVDRFSVTKHRLPYDTDVSGIINSVDTILPFTFSRTQFINENEEPCSISQDIGSIELSVSRVIQKELKYNKPYLSPGLEALKSQKASEKGKILAPHRISLGDEVVVPRIEYPTVHVIPYDPNDPGPYVTFRFQYRPRDFLQAQGILPPPPPTMQDNHEVIDVKTDPENVELDDEIEETERRLRQLRERKARRSQAAPYPKREAKLESREISSSSKNTTSLRQKMTEVIDLTSD